MPSAHDDAVKLLARRALTRRELVERLRARGHAPDDADDAVLRLEARGAVDDRELARAWIAGRGGTRGGDRLVAELTARGVDTEVARAAWSAFRSEPAFDPAAAVARTVLRRLGPPPGRADRGRLARVYNALLSEGFEPGAIAAALRPYGFEGIDP